MSPIGNPQNLLIAVDSPIPDPFITFPKYLLLPTIINLIMVYLVLKIFFHKEFNIPLSDNACDKVVRDTKMALLAKFSLSLFLFFDSSKNYIIYYGVWDNTAMAYPYYCLYSHIT